MDYRSPPKSLYQKIPLKQQWCKLDLTMSKSRITAIILNWNDTADTLECVNSLKRLKGNFTLEIVVVDNASQPSSIKNLENLESVILLKNKSNLGYTGGNNVGIDYALKHNADYLWVLNPDLRADTYCLDALLTFAQSHPRGGIFSPKIYFYPGFEYHKSRYSKSQIGKVVWYAGGTINWPVVLGRHLGVDEVDSGQFSSPKQIDFATGASIFAPVDTFRTLKGFDNKYYLYLEDMDLSVRLTKLEKEIWYVPTAILWHKNANSSKVGGGLQDYYFSRNRLLFGITYGDLKLKFALLRESVKLVFTGRVWQKRGIIDFFLNRLGQGSYEPKK